MPSSSTAIFVLSLAFLVAYSTAYDLRDPLGNVTIKWDVVSWTADGYIAVVTMYNYQKYRSIEAPGWKLGWTWRQKEIIWQVVGARVTRQGDCSRFRSAVPQSCERNPSIVDLPSGAPYNSQISHCCKGGIVPAWGQDPSNAMASFQISVGFSGNTNTTVALPSKFTLRTPTPAYACGPARIVRPTLFLSPDGRRRTQALMTWNVVCMYSKSTTHERHG